MSKEHHFWRIELRPRLNFQTPYSVKEFVDRITLGVYSENAPCKARIVHDHIVLFIPPEQQHYWSPQLSLSIEEDEQGTIITGLYGPRPAVWTMFIFFYSFIAFCLLFILIFGLSYLSMGKSAGILWLVPLLLLILLSIYRVARQGQILGKEEMESIHDFLKSCIENK